MYRWFVYDSLLPLRAAMVRQDEWSYSRTLVTVTASGMVPLTRTIVRQDELTFARRNRR